MKGTQNMKATSERCQEDPPKEEKKRVSSSSNLRLTVSTWAVVGGVPIRHENADFLALSRMTPNVLFPHDTQKQRSSRQHDC